MHKKLYIFATTLILCLTILLSTFLALPKLTQAAPLTSQSHLKNRSIIAVSPTNFTSSDTKCTLTTIGNTSYQACPVTIKAPQSGNTGVTWTSSYTAKDCYITCTPDYSIGIISSQGKAYANQNGQTYILIPEQCYHGLSYATVVFAGPINKVKVNFTCGEYA